MRCLPLTLYQPGNGCQALESLIITWIFSYSLTFQGANFTWHPKIGLYFNLSALILFLQSWVISSDYDPCASLEHSASGGARRASWGALLPFAWTMKVTTPVLSWGFFCLPFAAHCTHGSQRPLTAHSDWLDESHVLACSWWVRPFTTKMPEINSGLI